VLNEVFDLFAALDATEEQLDFPILYGSAKQGWMAMDARGPEGNGLRRCSTRCVRHVPAAGRSKVRSG
jgi:GTP-binding protein